MFWSRVDETNQRIPEVASAAPIGESESLESTVL